MTTITIPYDLNWCNPNRVRGHWAKRQAVANNARAVAREAWERAGSPTFGRCVVVSVLVRRGRKLDQANVWAALKPLIDGVFVRAATHDDSERWLKCGSVTQDCGKQWVGREEIVFSIEPEV